MMQLPANPVVSTEAARRLGVPHYTLYRLAQQGKLGAFVQVAGRYVFDDAALATYERERQERAEWKAARMAAR